MKFTEVLKSKRFKKSVGIVTLFLVAVMMNPFIRYIRVATAPPSSQSDYPVLPPIPENPDSLGDSSRPLDLDTMSILCDLVVEVTIGKTYDSQTVTYTPKAGSVDAAALEKLGMSSISNEETRVDLHIDRVLIGEESRKNISVWSTTSSLYYLPELKEGEKMILFLLNYNLVDGYVVPCTEGYFYLAADDKVYPARVTREIEETSGMDYSEFRERVQNAEKK